VQNAASVSGVRVWFQIMGAFLKLET
jgi:hypothetical protein